MWEEFHLRNQVLVEALKILSDGRQWRARQIMKKINTLGISVQKSLVNSVLFSEGRRYVTYDKKTYSYRLKDNFISSAPEGVKNSNTTVSLALANMVTIEQEMSYSFKAGDLDNSAFFVTDVKGGDMQIIRNKEHPLFSTFTNLSGDPQMGSEQLYRKLKIAQNCIKIMLTGWAEFENEQPVGKRRIVAQDARIDWGRKVRDLLMNSNEID